MKLSSADALQAVNAEFYDAYTRTDLMATAVIISLNPENGLLELANAGRIQDDQTLVTAIYING